MNYSRREFLHHAAASGMAALCGGTALAQTTAPASASDVYVGKGTADAVLPKLLKKMGGIERFVKPGARVLLKPNMSFNNPPEWATTTSPEAVQAVAKLCIEAGAKRVIVCDNTLHDPESCKQKTKILAAVKDFRGVVVFIPKQDSLYISKTNDRAKQLVKVDIVKEVYNVDCLISIAGAKSHSAAGVSFTIKGLMGLVKDRGVFHSEMDLHQAIAEQLYYFKPRLNIIDATRALIDNGPAGPGNVVELKTFVAGVDPVAVDSYGVSLASWYGQKMDGKRVKHLRFANELGFGNVESSMINEIMV